MHLANWRFRELAIYLVIGVLCASWIALPSTNGILSHHWKFDEPSGTTAIDSVGGVNGTLSANVTRVAGRVGTGAVALDGTDSSFVTFGNTVGQFGTTDFSVAFWFNTTEQQAVFDLVGNRSADSHANFIQFRMTGDHPSLTDGQIILELDQDAGGTNYVAVTGPGGTNDGAWHHVAATRAGTTVKLYIDGVLVDQDSSVGVTNISNGNPFKIGRSLGCCSDFTPEASFDDLRIYNVALSDGQVAALFNPPPQITSIVASPANIFPADRRFKRVTLTVVATDDSGLPPVCAINSVSANNGPFGVTPDFALISPLVVDLRAERPSGGVNRKYTISVQCTDGGGAVSPLAAIEVPVTGVR